MDKKYYLIVLLALISHNAWAGDYPNCNVSNTAPISFSSTEARDSLSVTVRGKPCYKADLDIQIRGKNGQLLYKYQAPFKKHIAVQWDDATLDKDAEKFVMRLTSSESFGFTSELPVWKPENEYYEDNYQVLKIEKEYYEVIRTKKWVTYTHPIHYEGRKVVTFDQNKNETVEVSSGGL